MQPADRARLDRILEVIGQLQDCIARNGITRERILKERDIQWMLSMPLAEIGEQAYRLSNALKSAYPEGEWPYVSGMRHRLVHNYEGIDFSFIADTVFEDLDQFEHVIRFIIAEEDKKDAGSS